MTASDFLFGYGSIINNSSRQSTSQDAGKEIEVAVVAELVDSSLERCWCFRSHTGFTALGLRRLNEKKTHVNFNNKNDNIRHNALLGVLFPVESGVMAQYDIREVGYMRVEVSSEQILIKEEYGSDNVRQKAEEYKLKLQTARIWTYIPDESRAKFPDKDHPILQSYVDICIRGCLEWGGAPFAQKFLLTVSGWSEFYLDDTPNSRRPWIHRKDFKVIDGILESVADHTKFSERRHPEEYSSRHMFNMTGIWGVPNRQPNYTGRLNELSQLHEKVLATENGIVEIIGMGGVGKTTLVSEYCHLHILSEFSLVVWFRAESGSSIASDMRRFGSEFGILRQKNDVKSNKLLQDSCDDDASVIEEIHRSFFKCRSNYLLVFDNVIDHDEVVRYFLPKGQQINMDGSSTKSLRHILFTSRVSSKAAGNSLFLSCFQRDESLLYLRNSLSNRTNSASCPTDGHLSNLAEALGHLPLALSMAGAYLTSCDISVESYVQRLAISVVGKDYEGLPDLKAVASSLNLTLSRIEAENYEVSQLLLMLGFLNPDSISKNVIQYLLLSVRRETRMSVKKSSSRWAAVCSAMASTFFIVFAIIVVVSDVMLVRLICVLFLSSMFAVFPDTLQAKIKKDPMPDNCQFKGSNQEHANTLNDVDRTWEILKKYSLLSSCVGQRTVYGSIHRLQAAALRYRCDTKGMLLNLERIIWALQKSWRFDSKDTTTWVQAGETVKHVQSLSVYTKEVIETIDIPELIVYITPGSLCNLTRLMMEAASYLEFTLSRFANAKSILEMSYEILNLLAPHCTVDIKADVASNMHALGRLLRYCGEFSRSEDFLMQALSMRDEAVAPLLYADTLHELGVLAIRKHQIDIGKQRLLKSLMIRKKMNSGESSIAASLHQLAIVATIELRYTDAEELLLECLELETGLTASRAATLQQLGRVFLRRGLINEAEKNFQESLTIYLGIYGESSQHLNVAGVYHQLGVAANLDQKYQHAKEYFQKSLSCKENIFSDADSIEIVIEMQALGQVELSLGNVDSAEALFSRTRLTCTRLIECVSIPCDGEAKDIFYDGSKYGLVLNSLILSIYSLRNVAKLKRDIVKANALGKEAKRVKKRYSKLQNETKTEIGEIAALDEAEVAIIAKLNAHRNTVRQLAAQLLGSSTPVSEVQLAIIRLSAIVQMELSEFTRIGCQNETLKTITKTFLGHLVDCKKSQNLVQSLFGASDLMRSGLRELNITVDDTSNDIIV